MQAQKQAVRRASNNRKPLTRSQLQLVKGEKRKTKVLPFLAVLVVVSALLIVLMQGIVAQASIQLEKQKDQLQTETYKNSSNRYRLANLSDPANVSSRASKEGMRRQEKIVYVYVDGSEKSINKFIRDNEARE